MPEDVFETRGKYLVRNFEAIDRRIKLTCVDRLKLTRKEIPAKISDDNVLEANITAGATSMIVSDATEITTPGDGYFVVLEIDHDKPGQNEKVNVTAIDLDTNTLTVQRGRWGTVSQPHASGALFRQIAEFGTERTDPQGVPLGKSPLDIIIELYRYAGLREDEIDSATMQAERDIWFPYTINTATGTTSGTLFRRTITEITDVEDLVSEIRQLNLLFLWMSESQQVTGKFFVPKLPGATVTTITDDDNIISGSGALDHNEESRISRVVIAWDLPEGVSPDRPEVFRRIRVELDVDAEEREWFGDPRLTVILSEWIGATDTATPSYLTGHLIARFRNGARIFRFAVDIKDDGIKLGDLIQVNSALVQDIHGNNLNSVMHVVKKAATDNRIELEALDTGLYDRTAFWAAAGAADYDAASTAELEYGYYTDSRGFVGTPLVLGYHWW